MLIFTAGIASCAQETTGEADPTESGADKTEPITVSYEFEDGAIYSLKNENWFAVSGVTFGIINGEDAATRGYQKDLDQLFSVQVTENGVMFKNMTTGLYLSVRKANIKDKSRVCLAPNTDNFYSYWNVIETEGGWLIQNSSSGMYLACEDSEGVGAVLQRASLENADVWTIDKAAEKDTVLPRVLQLSGDYIGITGCPEIVKYNGYYYNVGASGSTVVRRSSDLINWQKTGVIFNTKPAWIAKEIGSNALWCPAMWVYEDVMRIYYASSTLGSQNSVIGMAYSAKGDFTGPFNDGGMLIRSYTGMDYNCIDPCIFTDDDGSVYMLFGSYWTGIYMRKIDPATGLFDTTDTTLWHLARGKGEMEAPYLIKKDGYYYLFVALGNISKNDTYHFAVGRSESLFGPYVDKNGKPMLEGYASNLTEYKPGIVRTGHGAVFKDDDGQYYLVSESWLSTTDTSGGIRLHISTLVWNKKGWPVSALAVNLLDELKGH